MVTFGRFVLEMAKAQSLDHLRLDRRHVLVGLVGAKRGADDGAGGAAALGLTHELGDGLRDIVRIRCVLTLEHRAEGLDHGRGSLPDRAIGLRHFGVCGRMNPGEEVGRVSARLHLHDLDAELRDFVPEAVAQRFDCKFARAIDAQEGERHAAEDRADVDDQAIALLAHGREHSAGDAK